MTKPVSTKYLDVQEVANYCRMTIRTIYNLTSTRKIPFIKPNNGRLLFDREAIDAWLLESSVQPIPVIDKDHVHNLSGHKGLHYK
jgi:excisionase family DNA binding protein